MTVIKNQKSNTYEVRQEYIIESVLHQKVTAVNRLEKIVR